MLGDRSDLVEDMALVHLGRGQYPGVVVVVGCSIPFAGQVGSSSAELALRSEIADHMRLEGRIECSGHKARVNHQRPALADVVALRRRMGEVPRSALTL